ncbi:MAG: response regulator [Myxococcota bacterium]
MAPVNVASTAVIVEDEAVVAMDLERSLKRLGVTVLGVATTARDAVRMIRELDPDLMLLDVRLRDDRDGIWVAEQTRPGSDSALIFLTAHGDEVTMQRAAKMYPDGYLVKPVKREALETTIESALHSRDARRKRGTT